MHNWSCRASKRSLSSSFSHRAVRNALEMLPQHASVSPTLFYLPPQEPLAHRSSSAPRGFSSETQETGLRLLRKILYYYFEEKTILHQELNGFPSSVPVGSHRLSHTRDAPGPDPPLPTQEGPGERHGVERESEGKQLCK